MTDDRLRALIAAALKDDDSWRNPIPLTSEVSKIVADALAPEWNALEARVAELEAALRGMLDAFWEATGDYAKTICAEDVNRAETALVRESDD